jgi:transposase
VTGPPRPVRALKVARAGAVKARTQAGNQLRDLIVTAPEPLRRPLAGQPSGPQVDAAARFRPGGPACRPGALRRRWPARPAATSS